MNSRIFCGSFDSEHSATHLNPRRIIDQEENARRFLSNLNTFYWQAERQRALSLSWRNFCVGCSVYAFRQKVYFYPDHWKNFGGMNTKVLEGARNICAEPIPLNAAHSDGFTEAIGIVIVGVPQQDEKGIIHKTLRPCAHCRMLMKHHPLVKPHTLIVTAHPPPKRSIEDIREVTYEVHTFKKLLKEYGEA